MPTKVQKERDALLKKRKAEDAAKQAAKIEKTNAEVNKRIVYKNGAGETIKIVKK